MPYDTKAQIMQNATPQAPGNPRDHFSNFDPLDPEVWSYFIYLYLDASQSNDWGHPGFLPTFNRFTNSFSYAEGYNIERHPLLNRYNAVDDKIIKSTVLRSILTYVQNLVTEWVSNQIDSGTKLGFRINSQATYDGCLARVQEARDVAWEAAMKYSAESLYEYADPTNTRGRTNVAQSDDGLAFILPDMTILFVEVYKMWREAFPGVNLRILSGYRTEAHQRGMHNNPWAAPRSHHEEGAAIDVLPEAEFYQAFDDNAILGGENGRNMFMGYLAWLFRRVAERRLGTVEINGRQQVKIPHTLVENGNVLHVSYGWLLRLIGNQQTRQDILPSVVRPLNNDIIHPDGWEARVPGRLNPLLDYFNENSYRNQVDSLDRNGGVTSRWLFELITHILDDEETRDLISDFVDPFGWRNLLVQEAYL